MRPEVVIDGAPFAEGPAWCPDGTLVISHVAPGGLRRVWPGAGRSTIIARTGGGANAAQLASDGGFVVTQNGGFDFAPFAEVLGLRERSIPPYAPTTPGLQRVHPSGAVSYLVDAGMRAPNDLVVAADGTIFFTDPGHHPIPDPPVGRLLAYRAGDGLSTVADGFAYDNGVAIAPDGRLLVVEGDGLMWVERDGRREWFVRQLPAIGDGFCFDRDGRVYVAMPMLHAVAVVDWDGRLVDRLELGAGAMPTNCCFGGADGRTLFTTELRPGCVRAFSNMPTPGLPLLPWPVPNR